MTDRAIALPNFRRIEYEPARQPRRIRAVLLLAGGGALNELAAETRRAVLALPVERDRDLLAVWKGHLGRMNGSAPPVRVIGGVGMNGSAAATDMEHVAEPDSPRGTGGILRDLALDYPDDAHVLVASAAMLPLEPLDELVTQLSQTCADVAFFVDGDGVSPTLMLVRCGCLRSIADKGFVDFKEQALPKIASVSSVTVIRRNAAVAGSMRTASDYIRSLRAYHRRMAGGSSGGEGSNGAGNGATSNGAFSEDWRPTFSIAEPGAEVGAGARLHDSVVLAGAHVGRHAVVVRSVVCPGAVVPARATVLDQLVRPRNRRAAAHAGNRK